jgi:hypothetical protein
MVSSKAAQATAPEESQVQNEVNIALLSEALEVQEEQMTGLLRSLGIGQHVDIVV